jgi:hypothetical protein
MIGFFASNLDIRVGSYRIWVNDLKNYFNEIGITTKIFNNLYEVGNFETVIFSKADAVLANNVKQTLPHIKVGIINLSCDNTKNKSDFVVVGSIEEKISLSWHKNVFIFPLIENIFQNQQIKTHRENNEQFLLCYHGNTAHLSRFENGLKQAIEEINSTINVELTIITGDEKFNWVEGRPNINNIIFKKWDIDTIKQNILACDVGLVPNVSDVSQNAEYTKKINNSSGLYNTDFVIRMKNKSNAGRSFVFHQLGIPVVSDLTPSNLHILGDPDCGHVAFNKNSWKKSLEDLIDYKKRNFIAKNAKVQFDRLYDPKKWAVRLYKNIMELEI